MQHQIVIRRHRPWLRPALIAGTVAVLALAGWALYSFTRAKTVSDFARVKTEIEQLREERRELTRKLRAQRNELDAARQQLAYVERSASIDTQACTAVEASLQSLQQEASELREQLAFYRAVTAPDEVRAGVRVQALSLKPAGANRVRYQLTLIQSARQEQRVSGRIELGLTGRSASGETRLDATALAGGVAPNLLFSLRYFEEFSGEWQLPAGFVPRQLSVRLVPSGEAPAVEQRFDWNKLLAKEKHDETQR